MTYARPLPDFGAGASLLVLLLAIVGLSIILALAGLDSLEGFAAAAGRSALFLLWVALLSALLFSFINRCCGRFAAWFQVALGFVSVQGIVFVMTLAVVGWAQPVTATTESLLQQSVIELARNLGISLIVTAFVLRLWSLHQKWAAQVEAEANARMRSLQARIHPHFLFNALNTISSLIDDKPNEAEQATLDLSDLLRSGLSERSRHSIDEELELVRGYLRIESLRLGERLEVDWQLADDLPLEAELPVLLIQPLVENAVVHGIARLPAGGRLLIRGERTRRGRIRFLVENPLPGETDDAGQEKGNRMAQDNVRQRLDLAWEEGARLRTRQEDGRFSAELVLPVSAD